MMKKISNTDKDIKNKSKKYLVITLFFILLPYIVKLFVFFLYEGVEIDLMEDFIDGSFVMSAISLLAPIWYSVETVFDIGTKNGSSIPFTKVFVTLCVSSILYGLLFLGSCTGYLVKGIPVVLLSIALMIWSIYLAFKIHISDLSVNQPDQQRLDDEHIIIENMKKIESGKATENIRNGIEGELDFFDFEEEDE